MRQAQSRWTTGAAVTGALTLSLSALLALTSVPEARLPLLGALTFYCAGLYGLRRAPGHPLSPGVLLLATVYSGHVTLTAVGAMPPADTVWAQLCGFAADVALGAVFVLGAQLIAGLPAGRRLRPGETWVLRALWVTVLLPVHPFQLAVGVVIMLMPRHDLAHLHTVERAFDASGDEKAVTSLIAESLTRGLGAPWVRVHLPGRVLAYGQEGHAPATSAPLSHDGTDLGKLEVGGEHDPAVIRDFARAAARALHTVSRPLAPPSPDLRPRLLDAFEVERARTAGTLRHAVQRRVAELAVRLRLLRRTLIEPVRIGPGVAAKVATPEAAAAAAELEQIQDQARELLVTVRAISAELWPEEMTTGGLADAVTALVRRTPIPVETDIGELGRHPAGVEHAAFDCVQAALACARRTAPASPVEVRLACEENELLIEVSGEGLLFDDTGEEGHNPDKLHVLHDRVAATGGSLNVGDKLLSARFPVPESFCDQGHYPYELIRGDQIERS
ncbi:sensor histidine kinase [Rhizohabitans arisaemae]|uniref:sensor histidine kinase n=1 Tax=Rhizohabitans arisaemae TaxID=2720610 RepID=UPI0024B0C1C1|nr:hypothetical protein [Rhizohabitans arisaemae]